MYTTLSPCDMCKIHLTPGLHHTIYRLTGQPAGTGACLLFGISRVVIGENKTFMGGEAYLKSRDVEVVVLDNAECYDLMQKFIREKPEDW